MHMIAERETRHNHARDAHKSKKSPCLKPPISSGRAPKSRGQKCDLHEIEGPGKERKENRPGKRGA